MKESTRQKLREYDNEYKKNNYKRYMFRLGLKKDKAIIKYLDKQPDKTKYIKDLIIKDMGGE